jgi:hypothetical protein
MPNPISEYVLTPHAEYEMKRREIPEAVLRQTLNSPEQRIPGRGRDVLQSRFDIDGKSYLVRVFVDIDRQPPEVVTVYRTSKIDKYWRIDQ